MLRLNWLESLFQFNFVFLDLLGKQNREYIHDLTLSRSFLTALSFFPFTLHNSANSRFFREITRIHISMQILWNLFLACTIYGLLGAAGGSVSSNYLLQNDKGA